MKLINYLPKNNDIRIIIGLVAFGLLLLFLGRFFSFLIIIAVILLLFAISLSTMRWQSKFLDKIFRKNKDYEPGNEQDKHKNIFDNPELEKEMMESPVVKEFFKDVGIKQKKEAPTIASNIPKVAPPIAFAIPVNMPPASVGEYVTKLAREEYNIPFASSTTTNITAVAVQADKEKMRLSKITLQLGADYLPFKVNWEWEKK